MGFSILLTHQYQILSKSAQSQIPCMKHAGRGMDMIFSTSVHLIHFLQEHMQKSSAHAMKAYGGVEI